MGGAIGSTGFRRLMGPRETACPLCRAGTLQFDRDWSTVAWPILRCDRCGVRRVSEVPHEDGHAALYAQATYTNPVYASLPGLRARRRRELDLRLQSIESDLPGGRPGSLLDVGCSRGDLLETAHARGWTVQGIDPDPMTARDTSLRLGVPVKLGSVPLALDGMGAYDVIWMSHVLEHVPDPLAVLKAGTRHLTLGGAIVVGTPNAESWIARMGTRNWSWTCPPLHLWYFTRGTLGIAAERVGLIAEDWRFGRGDAHSPPLELAIVLAKSLRRGRRSNPRERSGAEIRFPQWRGAFNILLQLGDVLWPISPNRGSDEIIVRLHPHSV
jgi:SAM-dependent methyltransferase